jgi:hypothetical protein
MSAAAKPKGLYAALLAVQAEAPKLQKTAINPHFKSRFVPLEEVHEAVMPIVNKNGLVWITKPGINEHGPCLDYKLVHAETGEQEEGSMQLLPAKADPQGQGSAITYARRYALVAVLGLVPDEDDDGNGGSNRRAAGNGRSQTITARRPQATEDAVNPAQRRLMFAKAKEAGLDEAAIKAILVAIHPDGHGHSDRLPKSKLDTVLEEIQKAGNGAVA